MRRKEREHRPPRDLFVPGMITSLMLATIGFVFLYGSSAASASAMNAKTAQLFEQHAEGTDASSLKDRLGSPTERVAIGACEILRFKSPNGFGFEIDALIKKGKVVRIFALETEAHRASMSKMVDKFR